MTTIVDSAVATLQAAGDIDFGNADLLLIAVNDVIDQGARSLRLDVSRVDFCDCAGLRSMVEAHNRLLGVQGSLTIVGAGSRMRALLTITRLDEVLAVDDSDVAIGYPPLRAVTPQSL